ncbi:molybdopterin-dependent oxidoreductase [Paraburkholderia ginsengisoli]|uniref:Molybdopterin-dependent oxidoreductase n=1 Tax=Paraburkholderia ginsengisoli TaxID=311231 RepID=A0A7T4N9V3_9BURK|nr:molybdopterin-dependent oxidoreductase [Paraburkholderia ginsengisoli]QQC67868.1 molybdopterin-dependent oxidoreductase [Paraburkholderia ginsengisoli]
MRYLGIALLLFASSLSQVRAQTAPMGLDVTGNIANVTDASTHTYHFTRADLLGLESRTIKTSTNWTPVSVWRGPTLESILQKAGARGKVMHVYALDNYKHDVPLSDAKQYGVIMAYERDGKPLEEKGFGPLMLIYPRDDNQEDLNRASIEARFVWQIYKIVVE